MKTAITKADVPSIIASIPNGAIFTVTFVKKDKTVRVMNCRKGVTSGLVPNARPKAPNPANIITVYDMVLAKNNGGKTAYRCINADTVLNIKAEKQEFEVK